MIRTILAWFGYAQIPLEVVQLSMRQEAFLSRLHDAIIAANVSPNENLVRLLETHQEGQKIMTEFLRNCRHLTVRAELGRHK